MRNYEDLLQGVKLRAVQLWGNSGFRSDRDENWRVGKWQARHGPDDGGLEEFVDAVRKEAYAAYEARGREHGHDLEDFLSAWMSQLKARCGGGGAPNRFSSTFIFDPSIHDNWREKVAAFKIEAAQWDPSVCVVMVESLRALDAAIASQKTLAKTIYLVGLAPQKKECRSLADRMLEEERCFHTDAARFRTDQQGYREVTHDPHGLHEIEWQQACFGALCDFWR